MARHKRRSRGLGQAVSSSTSAQAKAVAREIVAKARGWKKG